MPMNPAYRPVATTEAIIKCEFASGALNIGDQNSKPSILRPMSDPSSVTLAENFRQMTCSGSG